MAFERCSLVSVAEHLLNSLKREELRYERSF